MTKSLLSNPTGHERSVLRIREGQSGTGKGVFPNSAENRGGVGWKAVQIAGARVCCVRCMI